MKWGDRIIQWFKDLDWLEIGLWSIFVIAIIGLALCVSWFIVELVALAKGGF